MNPKQATYKEFRKRGPARDQLSMAHMAVVAMNDCWNGGAKAMVLARRLANMGSKIDYDAIVGDAYANSRGMARNYLPYECQECGCIHLGIDAANECCQPEWDEEDDRDEWDCD